MPGRPPGERDRIAVRVRGGAVVPGFGELVENRLMGKTGFFGGVACLLPPPMPGAGLPDGLQQRLPGHRVDRAFSAAGRSTRA